MARTLSLGLNFDALSFGVDIDFRDLNAAFERVSERAQESRSRESEGMAGPAPQRYYIACPHCGADATFLGSTELPDRKIRLCFRCSSLFEVT